MQNVFWLLIFYMKYRMLHFYAHVVKHSQNCTKHFETAKNSDIWGEMKVDDYDINICFVHVVEIWQNP